MLSYGQPSLHSLAWIINICVATQDLVQHAIGSFHAQSTKNCKDPPQILTKLGVFGVLMVLITHADF